MMFDPLQVGFLVIALVAVGYAFYARRSAAPDLARITSERDQARSDLETRKTEAEAMRSRLDKVSQIAAAADARYKAAEAQLVDEKARSQSLHDELGRQREQLSKTAAEVAAVRERTQFADETLVNMKETFAAQSTEAVRAALDDLRKAEADAREQRERLERERLSAQLKPVADTLERFEKHVTELETKRAADVGGLKAQIDSLMQASQATQAEARKLSTALRRGAGVQGRWGEQTLRNVLESAGLASRFDFQEQFQMGGEDKLRPDVVVQMPGGGVFVIDAKCSLTAYLESQDAPDEAARDASLMRHAASLRGHITGLSGKAYWDQFRKEKSPDFVAMFVPGDSFLVAALDRAPDLMTEAMDKRVLLVTPTTLFGLCKAVAYGWRVEEQAANADKVAKLGKDLYARIATMGSHAQKVGEALGKATTTYNAFIGSLESQVLTQARRFEELKVDHEGKELPELPLIETAIRPLTKLPAS